MKRLSGQFNAEPDFEKLKDAVEQVFKKGGHVTKEERELIEDADSKLVAQAIKERVAPSLSRSLQYALSGENTGKEGILLAIKSAHGELPPPHNAAEITSFLAQHSKTEMTVQRHLLSRGAKGPN
jgi:hypothetical protein